MKNSIKCPKCGEEIEINDVLKHQIEDEVSVELEAKYKANAEKLVAEEKERNKKLSDQIDELLTETRNLRRKDEDRELEMKKKLLNEEEKIRIDARKKSDEDHQLKDLEKEKIISDLKKSLEDAQRKASQGSQQTQGEVFELEFENILRKEFPNDLVSEVGKGVKGGDIVQEVIDSHGNSVGKILWELKNTKTWSEEWVNKLKGDKRNISAEDAVLITQVLPNDMKSSGAYRNGIWVTKQESVVAMASVLRAKLIQLFIAKNANDGKDEKMNILFTYLSGTEFKNRTEAMLEAWSGMQEDIEKEKRYFSGKWARDDKRIRQVIDNTLGMRGDLEGIMGNSLPEIKTLELPDKSE
jgi:hypothetical protein